MRCALWQMPTPTPALFAAEAAQWEKLVKASGAEDE